VDGLNIFHGSSQNNVSDCKKGQATPREIQYISLKVLSSVEDDTMQYGALDKLTRKINVKLRFVSSPVSLEKLRRFLSYFIAPRIHNIFSSDTLNFGHGERSRGKPLVKLVLTRMFARCNRPDLIISNSDRSFGSCFLRASRSLILLVNVPDASRLKRSSNGFRHRTGRAAILKRLCNTSFRDLAKPVKSKLLWVKCFKARHTDNFRINPWK